MLKASKSTWQYSELMTIFLRCLPDSIQRCREHFRNEDVVLLRHQRQRIHVEAGKGKPISFPIISTKRPVSSCPMHDAEKKISFFYLLCFCIFKHSRTYLSLVNIALLDKLPQLPEKKEGQKLKNSVILCSESECLLKLGIQSN